MIGHLGARVSALLDGQLPPEEAEEAWAHVYACHACRDLVEREGWVKTRLATLGGGPASEDLKGSLLSLTPGERYLAEPHRRGAAGRRGLGAVVLGGGAVGAAMAGVLALGLAPGSNPPSDRRPPTSRIETPAVTEQQRSPRTPAPALASTPNGSRTSGPTGTTTPYAVPAWVDRFIH